MENRDCVQVREGKISEQASRSAPRRVLVLGGTGTIGRAAVRALVARGHEVTCLVRPGPEAKRAAVAAMLPGAEVRFGDVTSPASLRAAFGGERFDVVLSCLASGTGAPADAWAIDHRAHSDALAAAREAGVGHMVLLSAICVQKPLLDFQKAKLAFEAELIGSGLTYSIVRPTAFFKSLSGQVERVRQGKPYLLFGDGRSTACKPISDADLADYLAGCVDDPAQHDRILPIGGPGPAITPREQGEELFRLTGRAPKFRSVPVGLISAIAGGLGALGRIFPTARDKAEFARIAHYYATESMLVLNPETGRYDAEATPAHGRETLFDHYARLIAENTTDDRGEHALF